MGFILGFIGVLTIFGFCYYFVSTKAPKTGEKINKCVDNTLTFFKGKFRSRKEKKVNGK